MLNRQKCLLWQDRYYDAQSLKNFPTDFDHLVGDHYTKECHPSDFLWRVKRPYYYYYYYLIQFFTVSEHTFNLSQRTSFFFPCKVYYLVLFFIF